MDWRKSTALILLMCLFSAMSPVAQNSLPAASHDYRKAFIDLYQAVQHEFYDSAHGLYRDFEQPAPKYGYAYCWPLCGLLQAFNEAEAAGIAGVPADHATAGQLSADPSSPSVRRITALLDLYKSNKPPMAGGNASARPDPSKSLLVPGYDSYLVQFGGGDRFYDDNQWLGLAWMDGWFRTKEPGLLERGKLIYRFMMTGYDTASGGGLYWEEGKRTSKNTCSNGPGIVLALQLYRATKERKYLDTALLLYHWVDAHLRDSDGLYFDNIRLGDHRIGKAKFSYNTGTMLQASVYLYELTEDKTWLQRATAIADSAAPYFYGAGKFRDGYWFNAVLARGFEDLLKFNKNPAYLQAFQNCLDESLDHDQTPTGLMGARKQQLLVNQAGMLEMLARMTRIGATSLTKGDFIHEQK
jgi:Glycosyl hydrolase family 76